MSTFKASMSGFSIPMSGFFCFSEDGYVSNKPTQQCVVVEFDRLDLDLLIIGMANTMYAERLRCILEKFLYI